MKHPRYFLTASSELPLVSNFKTVAMVDEGNTRSPAAYLICHVSADVHAKFPREIHHKRVIVACKRASVKNIRVDVNQDKLLFSLYFNATNAFEMQQLILK